MQFDFATAGRILFGCGKARETGKLAAAIGQRALLVTGGSSQPAEPVLSSLRDAGISVEVFRIKGEPTVALARQGVAFAHQAEVKLVIGCGGGSALDAGKAIAALLKNPGDVLDYLEVIGAGKPLQNPPLPYIAIPATAGTGSEATRNAVLTDPERRVKASLRSPLMLPSLALVDPEMTISVPPQVTASTGMDALAQVIEPYVSISANPLTDLYCQAGIRRAAVSLLRAFQRGDDLAARTDMAFASLMGGLALANAGLGAVHGFAAPLGGMYLAPHGAVCARLLPPVTAVNARALQERQPHNPAPKRYRSVAELLTGKEGTGIEQGVVWLEELAAALNIPRLSAYGLGREEFPLIIEKARQASSMKRNPLSLTDAELGEILERAF